MFSKERKCECLLDLRATVCHDSLLSWQMTGIEVMLAGSGRCVFLSWRGAGGDAASAYEALQASRSSRGCTRNTSSAAVAPQEADWGTVITQQSTM